MRSKISLKFSLAAADLDKKRLGPQIKQSIIDDFERAYVKVCDQDRQRARGRNVSMDSQFDPTNIPPKEYLQNDPKYLEKPGRIDLKSYNTEQALAGRLSEIGQ